MWWGVTVLAIGTVSAVLGVLYALMEHDLKRLLAYHSIENIGIILMGLGASLMFLHQRPSAAGRAGADRRAVSHHQSRRRSRRCCSSARARCCTRRTRATWKKWAGWPSGCRRRRFFFLIGAVAISALPPLNGFVSEWLTYQSLAARLRHDAKAWCG